MSFYIWWNPRWPGVEWDERMRKINNPLRWFTGPMRGEYDYHFPANDDDIERWRAGWGIIALVEPPRRKRP